MGADRLWKKTFNDPPTWTYCDHDVTVTAGDQAVAKMRPWCGRGVASVWIYQDHTSGYTIFNLYLTLLYKASCYFAISDVPSSISAELLLTIVYTPAPSSHRTYYRNQRYRIVSFAYDVSGLTVLTRKYMYFFLFSVAFVYVTRCVKSNQDTFFAILVEYNHLQMQKREYDYDSILLHVLNDYYNVINV